MLSPRTPALIVLSIALLPGLATAEAERAAGRYVDATHGFSLTPPAFERDESSPVSIIAVLHAPARDGFAANVNVQVQRPGMPFDEFKKLSGAQLASGGRTLVSVRELEVGGKDAVEWVYEGPVQGRQLKFRALAVHRGAEVFLVTCTAPASTFADYDAAFRATVESFELD